MAEDLVVLPLVVPRDRVPRAAHFRSTWIVASLEGLRARNYFDRYVEHLPDETRDEILHCVAGSWLPMALARSHYDACERLNLSVDEQLQMGDAVGNHGAATLIATAARAAKTAGVTPWSIFPQFDRIWRRGADGGAVTVTRRGPKEALGEVIGCELFEVPYFRVAFRGVVLTMMRHFCAMMYLREVAPRPWGELRLRFQWA